jgi:prephenate dehydrogenase
MKIAVIGMGQMGYWFAEHFAREHDVAAFDTDVSILFPSSMKRLSNISELTGFDPEMVLNAVPYDSTIDIFSAIIPYINQKCLLSDITPVKSGMSYFYKNINHPFVSTHPMFGPLDEKLNKENAILIEESDSNGIEFFKKFYSEFDINLHSYTFEDHDRITAYSLSVPFVSSIVFAGCVDDKDVPGSNFNRHMKIARGLLSEDTELISEVLFNPASLKQVEKINQRLSYLTHIIKGEDKEELIKFLSQLKENINDE